MNLNWRMSLKLDQKIIQRKMNSQKKKNVGHHCTHFKVRVSEGEARQERSRVAPIVV